MAEKELRKMSRTELIEIIYALQQNERSLREENEDLRRRLEDKTIRIENAGSIAEAALSLNRIFEDAQAAAQQYLDSLRAAVEGAAATPADAPLEPSEVTADAPGRKN
ncbi:MAG: DNA repair protein [Clostridiales bacterium]|nr:DNA repair protein [Clostridiales bacterium]